MSFKGAFEPPCNYCGLDHSVSDCPRIKVVPGENMNDFYTTKVLIEVEVCHQFDPKQGIGIVVGRLSGKDIPAVKSIKVVAAESNYKLHSKPMDKACTVDLNNL